MRSGNARAVRRDGGFTYLGLVILVTVIGLVGAATLKVDSLLRRAAAEEELLEIGAAFSDALRTYAEATPKGQPAQPPSLQELLKDPRSPAVRRHLRKIFVDPLTGKAEWGIVWVNPGNRTGVLAVYSLSQAKPLNVAHFDARFVNLENKEHIADWKFAATGQAVAQGQVQGSMPGQTPGQMPGQMPAPGQPQPGQPSLFQEPPAPPGQPSLFPERAPAPASMPAPAPLPSEPPAPAPSPEPPPAERAGRDDGDAPDGKDMEPPASAVTDGR